MQDYKQASINEVIAQYRKARKRVWREATEASTTEQHKKNQETFRERVTALCARARPERFRDADLLWDKMWKTIRYAGFKAARASEEIQSLETGFDDFKGFGDFKAFAQPDWEPGTGRLWREFLSPEKRAFGGKLRVRNEPKLRKTVQLARGLHDFCKGREPGSFDAMDFLTNGLHRSGARWEEIHQALLAKGYTGHLTALHLMMDLGFPVMKPDIVLTRLFVAWKWVPAHRWTANLSDLTSKGAFLYTKPDSYSAVINVAQQAARQLGQMHEALHDDIGWVTDNPLREFDIFLVKFGQEPDHGMGLTRNLARGPDGVQGWPAPAPANPTLCGRTYETGEAVATRT